MNTLTHKMMQNKAVVNFCSLITSLQLMYSFKLLCIALRALFTDKHLTRPEMLLAVSALFGTLLPG
jgi:hypothetical protein